MGDVQRQKWPYRDPGPWAGSVMDDSQHLSSHVCLAQSVPLSS